MEISIPIKARPIILFSMRTYLLCFITCAAVFPLWAKGSGDSIASCHITYTWRDSVAKDLPTITNAKDYRLTPDQIAKLPHFREVKITMNGSGVGTSPLFKGEIVCETEDAEVRYTGTFNKALFRDTFTTHGDPVVLLPPTLPQNAGSDVPMQSAVPPGLDCRWGGSNADGATLSGESFGLVVQLYDRHTQWLHARFTGTYTKKSKSLFGGTSTHQIHDTDIVFPTNHAITEVMLSASPFRF